ncbi:hypothetical protein V5O48_018906, partial [Marasmius crinis-equi]
QNSGGMLATSILFQLLAAVVETVNAQAFAPNPAWDSPNISTPTGERIAIARAGIDKTLSMIVDTNEQLKFEALDYATIGNFLSEMAQFDMLTNQTLYKAQLLEFFPQAEKFRPGFIDFSMNAGIAYSIAATQAYTTYSNESFLEWAELAWRGGRIFTVGEDEIGTGNVSGKNFKVLPTCAASSSMLAEATKNQTYIDFGLSSKDFYVNHLRNPEGVMLDGIDATSCTPHSGLYPFTAGLMMEGFAVLESVSNQDTDTILSYLMEIVNNTVSNQEWHEPDGIFSADAGQFVVRGLTAIYRRNTSRSPLRAYIEGYLGVQYNAVVNNARGQGSDTDVYGNPWTGAPLPLSFSLGNQTNALSILISAIAVQNDALATPGAAGEGEGEPTGGMGSGTAGGTGGGKGGGGSGGGGPHSPTSASKTSSNVGAIAGGVVGGVTIMTLVAISVLWLIRRRSSMQASFTDPGRSGRHAQLNQVEPFVISRLEKRRYRGWKLSSQYSERSHGGPVQERRWQEDEVLPDYTSVA